MLKLRIKQRYLLISCLSLILGMYIFSYFNGFNYLDIIFKIYPEEFPNFSSYMVQVFHFDKFFSDATHYFPFLLPILSIIPTIHFKEEIENYFFHALIRKGHYKREIFKSVFINALIIALAIYFSYVICISFSYFIFPLREDSLLIYDVLFDVIGSSLYDQYRLLYFIVVGVLQVFIPVFIMSFLSLIVMLKVDKKNIAMVLSFCIYYFFSMIFFIILSIFPDKQILLYLNPSMLLSLNGLSYPSTVLSLTGFGIYFVLCVGVLWLILQSREKKL